MNALMCDPKVLTTPQSMARRLIWFVAACSAVLTTTQAHAIYHLWNIREIYTDNTGNLQFIEFFSSSSSQQYVGGQAISVANLAGTLTHSFSIPANLPGDTLNHAFLIGTDGIHGAGGPSPDYIMPAGFLFSGGGMISFFGQNSGAYQALRTDGVLSRNWGDGDAVNSPQNFAGQSGVVAVPEPGSLAFLGVSAIGLCFWLRWRSR